MSNEIVVGKNIKLRMAITQERLCLLTMNSFSMSMITMDFLRVRIVEL